jgi:hypothetical protein
MRPGQHGFPKIASCQLAIAMKQWRWLHPPILMERGMNRGWQETFGTPVAITVEWNSEE